MKFLLAGIFACIFYSMNAFSIDVASYLDLKGRDDSYSSLVLEGYLRGLADGTLAANGLSRYENQQNKNFNDSFCPLEHLEFNIDMVRMHIDSYIRHAEAISALDKTADVGLLFVAQLNKTYPCK